MSKDITHISGGAAKNNYPKHYALATGKQNKQGAIPGGSPCAKRGSSIKNSK